MARRQGTQKRAVRSAGDPPSESCGLFGSQVQTAAPQRMDLCHPNLRGCRDTLAVFIEPNGRGH